jgi:anti-sigma regulatory factor (Ser/Thr protein kinase)
MDASPSMLSGGQCGPPGRRHWQARAGRWRPGSHARRRHGLEARLPATPESARTARHVTRQLLTDWGLGALTDNVMLVTSELATNAITAADDSHQATVALWLTRTPGGVLVAVADPAAPDGLRELLRAAAPAADPASPAVEPDELAEHGRGLTLAAALAERVGWYRAGRWKVVWASFGVPAGAGDAAAAEAEAHRGAADAA